MSKLSSRFAVCLVLGMAAPALAQQAAASPAAGEGTHVLVNSGELVWVDAPPGLPKGVKLAVLEGDPSKPGPFTMRGMVPANYMIAPHTHPGIEHVTVIQGEAYMGMGEKVDKAAAKKLAAGGFAVMPVGHVHYFFTKGKKATIQVHGVGPWGITYVNPADDPRNAGAAAAAGTK
jgi:hypothetical protein